jgi:hypothetical protein
MPITLVPDPTWKGKPPAPLMVKSDAMRKLAGSGVPIQKIAELYGVPYGRVYKAVNPPRKAAGEPGSKVRMPLTPARAKTLTRKQLEKIAFTPSSIKNAGGDGHRLNPYYNPRDTEAALDELERRGIPTS